MSATSLEQHTNGDSLRELAQLSKHLAGAPPTDPPANPALNRATVKKIAGWLGQRGANPASPALQPAPVSGINPQSRQPLYDRKLLSLASVRECQPPTGDGPFLLFDPTCAGQYRDQFRLLRTQLMLHRDRFEHNQNFRIVCVMSTHKAEGKSFTASNLASMLALAGSQRVLLIDSDAQSCPIPIGIPLPEEAGLPYALSNPANWTRTLHRLKDTPLYIMARGGSQPSRNLDFTPLPHLLEILRWQFEWIIVDGAAFASSPDARWLPAVTDGTLLVVRESASSFGAVQESLASIPPERLVGVVFNQWKDVNR
jgi:Mrp family chromosome partitioning ATPase